MFTRALNIVAIRFISELRCAPVVVVFTCIRGTHIRESRFFFFFFCARFRRSYCVTYTWLYTHRATHVHIPVRARITVTQFITRARCVARYVHVYRCIYIYSPLPCQRDVNDEHLACTETSPLSLSDVHTVHIQVHTKNRTYR